MDRKFFQNSAYILAGFIIIFSAILLAGKYGFPGRNADLAAKVIDVDTGKPVQGAVGLAVWRGEDNAVKRIEEAASDEKGNLYIHGFWKGGDPDLTVYKPGYVCWNRRTVFVDNLFRATRTNFSEKNRFAGMKKWPEGFSFLTHRQFIEGTTHADYRNAAKQLFAKAITYENQFAAREDQERKQELKEREEASPDNVLSQSPDKEIPQVLSQSGQVPQAVEAQPAPPSESAGKPAPAASPPAHIQNGMKGTGEDLSPQEKAELDRSLKSKWNDFRKALERHDIDTAVSFMSMNSRDSYRKTYSKMSQQQLSRVSQDLSDIQMVKMRTGTQAEYDIQMKRDGKKYSSQLIFEKNGDGVWEIKFF